MVCFQLMYILAIDTTTSSGGAAISRNSEVLGVALVKKPLSYSDQILHYVEFLLSQLGLTMQQLDCLAVSTGPGSFTGVRIGLATVKALSQSLDRPVVGVSTLAALAYRFRHVSPRVAPFVDARRQQIYGALYEIQNRHLHLLLKEEVMAPADWLKTLPQASCLFVGDGSQMYRQTIRALRPKDRCLGSDNRILDELCELAYWAFTRGETLSAVELRANYIRPSDAELPVT
jgi:tRNA threonylcarbamoyladenosine biosynthesis protein TsaB